MNADNIQLLLASLGSRKLRVTDDKVLGTCPLEHEHASGRDNSPSFVVFVNNSGESLWHCSYPHADPSHGRGGMDHMVRLFAESRDLPYAVGEWGDWDAEGPCLNSLYKFVWQHDCSMESPSQESVKLDRRNMPWSPKRRFQKKLFRPTDEIPAKELLPELPRNFLNQFDPPNKDMLNYLREERGLYDYTIDHWELMHDPAPRWDRIVIPIRDLKGKLVAFSRRALYDYQSPKYWHMPGFHRRYYLFGESPKDLEPLSTDNRRGIIVEGQFDVIRLWQYGYRGAVAIFGANMTTEQIIKFKSLFTRGVALMDADAAGGDASERLRQQFEAANVPLEIAHLPKIEGLDPGSILFTKDMAIEILGEPEVDNDWPL